MKLTLMHLLKHVLYLLTQLHSRSKDTLMRKPYIKLTHRISLFWDFVWRQMVKIHQNYMF